MPKNANNPIEIPLFWNPPALAFQGHRPLKSKGIILGFTGPCFQLSAICFSTTIGHPNKMKKYEIILPHEMKK